ncbi:DUF1028 domain-containing protein [Phytomonospora endophytica]|uniref:Putative Ntn-hydrolase superfamily protein n=1 Tax=Phytomonospora endophytica TaxID=714109 RepID=A0A841FQC7_9ACTN|nr:DUF1028 domain-containing protein [Phytomonospora endophytica]MBB6038286.1 putative Ntn-hydrolase superfamily protein [Phytomonospora endophytica]GIG64215.1 hypothetical protein Pen01_05100 [Phytomonospora endophytica]
MTFSIVARSDDGTMHGVAVASKFLAAGAVVPEARAGIGALATQAFANLAYRPQGMAMLATGVAPADVIAALAVADPGRAERQLGIVGTEGPGATFTGDECMDWAGGVAGDGFAAQGNILTGPEVVEAIAAAWLDGADMPFPARLLAALRAGDEAGGDRRGRQSAGLYVVGKGLGYGGTSDVAVDLRVDDHTDPVGELGRLLGIHELLFGTPDPATLLDLDGELGAEVRSLLDARGHRGPSTEDGLDRALSSWAGIENLEERLVPGRIDPLVLAHLRAG